MVSVDPTDPGLERLDTALAAAPDLGSLSLRIEARGLRNDRELLTFGIELERTPGVTDVILERCVEQTAVFVVHGADITGLLADGEAFDGFAVELAGPADAPGTLGLIATRPGAHVAKIEAIQRVTAPAASDASSVPTTPWPSAPDPADSLVALAAGVSSDPVAQLMVAAPSAVAVVAPAARPGGRPPTHEDIVMTVGPFRSFDRVNALQDGVTALDGVRRVEVGRFYRGTLRLKVQYEGLIPFAQRLRQLNGFGALAISQQGEDTIDVSLPE